MKRTVNVEIAGKTYPLRQTLGVLEWIEEKHGNLASMLESMVSGGSQIGTLLDIMAELMKAGAAYETKYGDPEVEYERDDKGRVLFLSREDLSLICDDDDLPGFIDCILEAFELAKKTEVQATETAEAKKSKKKTNHTHEATK